MSPGRDRRPDLVLVPEKSGPECTGSSGPEEFCTWPMSDFLWSGSDFLWSRSDFLWSRSDFLWSGSIFSGPGRIFLVRVDFRSGPEKMTIWTRINLVRVTRTRSGPGRLEIWPGDPFFPGPEGKILGDATQIFEGQDQRSDLWSRGYL